MAKFFLAALVLFHIFTQVTVGKTSTISWSPMLSENLQSSNFQMTASDENKKLRLNIIMEAKLITPMQIAGDRVQLTFCVQLLTNLYQCYLVNSIWAQQTINLYKHKVYVFDSTTLPDTSDFNKVGGSYKGGAENNFGYLSHPLKYTEISYFSVYSQEFGTNLSNEHN